MGIKLIVPTVSQTTNTCWHASALMVWYYSQSLTGRQGPMNSLGSKWAKSETITFPEITDLAKKVGLKALEPIPTNFDSKILERLLRDHGPLWCAGNWFGLGHAIVLTGVDDSYVYFNDPNHGQKKYDTILWFNQRLYRYVEGCIMYKDPYAY